MDECSPHVLYGNLSRKPTTITRGAGVYIFDEDGKRYLDAVGGIGVVNIGHSVEEIVRTIAD